MATQPTNTGHAVPQGSVNSNPLVNEHPNNINLQNFRDTVRDSVHHFVKSGAKVVDPTSLTNILNESVGNPIGKLSTRMDEMEVTLQRILTGINNITAGQGLANGDVSEKLDIVEKTVKKVAAIVPKMSNVLINHLDTFQWMIDESIRTFGERMARMQRLQLHHLVRLNDREQRSRSWTVRFHNFPNYSDEDTADDVGSKDLATTTDKAQEFPTVNEANAENSAINVDKRAAGGQESDDKGADTEPVKKKATNSRHNKEVDIWTKIIRPSLEIAKMAGDIDWVPTMKQAIEIHHPLYSKPGMLAPVLFRFYSRPVMFSFLKHKSEPIKAFNEQNEETSRSAANRVKYGPFRPLRVGADLTDLNRRLLTWLYNQEEIAYSKISGNRIIFQRRDLPGRWWTLSNPFGSTIEEMTKQPCDVHGFLMGSVFPTPPFLQNKQLNSSTARRLDFDESATTPSSSTEAPTDRATPQASFKEPMVRLFKRTKMYKSMEQMRKSFEREVLVLSEELGIIKESQESVINTTEDLVKELSSVIEEANTLAGGELNDGDTDENEDMSTDDVTDAAQQVLAPAPANVNELAAPALAPTIESNANAAQQVLAPAPAKVDKQAAPALAPIADNANAAQQVLAPAPAKVDKQAAPALAPIADTDTVDSDTEGGVKRNNAHLTPPQPGNTEAPALTGEQQAGNKKAKNKAGRPKTRANQPDGS